MPKLVCGDCGREFWDDADYGEVKDGGDRCSECITCGLELCPRCRANHVCDMSFLDDDDD